MLALQVIDMMQHCTLRSRGPTGAFMRAAACSLQQALARLATGELCYPAASIALIPALWSHADCVSAWVQQPEIVSGRVTPLTVGGHAAGAHIHIKKMLE
jgi:hypothetical protein